MIAQSRPKKPPSKHMDPVGSGTSQHQLQSELLGSESADREIAPMSDP